MGISLYEQFQKEQGAGGTGSLREEFEREQGDATPQRRAGDKPRGFRTPEQIERLNANDLAAAEEEMAQDRRTTRGKVLGTLAAPLSEVPGGGLLQRGISGDATKDAIASAPAVARIPAKLLGGVAAAGAMPATALKAAGVVPKLLKPATALARSAALQGATYGAASGLLEEDPNAGIGRRLLDAGIQGTVGAALGKGAELASTAIRGARAKDLATNLTERSVKRAEESAPLFAAFRKLGDLGKTPELDDILALPIVERAAKVVQGESPTLAKLPLTDARVLDAIYKRVGDKAFTAKHGYESAEALDALGDAIEAAARAKGGTYRAALKAFADPSKEMQALKAGREATRFGASPAGTPMAKATTQSPDAFVNRMTDRITGPTAGERQAAEEGILAMVKQGPTLARLGTLKTSVPLLGVPSRTLRSGARLLRETGAKKPALQELIEALAAGSTPTR